MTLNETQKKRKDMLPSSLLSQPMDTRSSVADGTARSKRPRSASPEEHGQLQRLRPRFSTTNDFFEQTLQEGAAFLKQGHAPQALASFGSLLDTPAATSSAPFNRAWASANRAMAQAMMEEYQLGALIPPPSINEENTYDRNFVCQLLRHHLATLHGATRSLELLAQPSQRSEWPACHEKAGVTDYKGELFGYLQTALADADRVFDKVAELSENRSMISKINDLLSIQWDSELYRHQQSLVLKSQRDPWFLAVYAAFDELHDGSRKSEPCTFWTSWRSHQHREWSRRPEVIAAYRVLRDGNLA